MDPITTTFGFTSTTTEVTSGVDLAGKRVVVTGAAANAQLTYVISGHLWESEDSSSACGSSRWAGSWHVLSTFVGYVFARPDLVVALLPVPATIGELWIVDYLILFGLSESTVGRMTPVLP